MYKICSSFDVYKLSNVSEWSFPSGAKDDVKKKIRSLCNSEENTLPAICKSISYFQVMHHRQLTVPPSACTSWCQGTTHSRGCDFT
jgi:hypothetical protein